MALALSALYNTAVESTANQNKVAAAIAIAAMAVLVEDAGTAQHAARLAWAQKSLLAPQAMALKMIWGVLGDANVIAAMPNVSDAVIQSSVNALVNSFLNA